MTDRMKLPNGDTIELGGYGVTRDGRKVGPMVGNGCITYKFLFDGFSYTIDGFMCSDKRAHPDDIIAAWKEPAAEPVLFKDMTDAEQGALLLAKHRGEAIYYLLYGLPDNGWKKYENQTFDPRHAYRVAPPEPKVETVVFYFSDNTLPDLFRYPFHTHSITLTVDDGIINGVAKVEALE
jgi:hypothetical protein